MSEKTDNESLRIRRDVIDNTMALEIHGRISGLSGLTVEVSDFAAPVGAQCEIVTRTGPAIPAEVIGFRGEVAVLMPLSEMAGIACGDWVVCLGGRAMVPVGEHLLGRVINGAGEPIDGKGPLLCQTRRSVFADALSPLERRRIDTPISTGIRVIDAMMTCGCGQRIGIFSGPGVGKSVLLGMIGRYTSADVNVIGLVGERGREVQEFIEKDLGPEGLARSVVVVSISNEPAPLRVRAGFVATTIAEYFRDQSKDVLLLMDSVTRIAMAQRQIGLALGEPPATRGYTPSVFALLPRLLERCGRSLQGSITGFYTVLVEGDDLSEPVSDALRGVLDGHLWLSRDLANRGHYPAVDILESISRVMPDVVDEAHLQFARMVTHLTAVYRDIKDLVNIGAYAEGTNPEYDLAVRARAEINQFLQQLITDRFSFEQARHDLKVLVERIAGGSVGQNANPQQSAQGVMNQPSQNNFDNQNQRPKPGLERMMAGV